MPVVRRQIRLPGSNCCAATGSMTTHSARSSSNTSRRQGDWIPSWLIADCRLIDCRLRKPKIEIRKSTAEPNPGATQFIAEAEVWRSHFEQAAPPLSALSAEYPADASLGHRAADINRSLASLEGTGYRGQVTGNAS